MRKLLPVQAFLLLSVLVILIFTSGLVFGQNAGISSNGDIPPNSAAGLDVNFANKGLLIPRIVLVSTTSATPMSTHVAGMVIYNTATAGEVSPGLYFNDGIKWIALVAKANTGGDMQYWNGSKWVTIPTGQPGQRLQVNSSGVPAWAP